MFTIEELYSYLPDAKTNPERAELLRDLTLGLIYELIPSAVANVSLVAKGVGLEVAARAFRNADGYQMESIDDYTYRRDSKTRSPGVYLTGDERAALTALTASPGSRVRSVKLKAVNSP